jgi:hypothetical protein
VRFRNSVTAAGLLALLGASALPAIGQEEPLPQVQPRTFAIDAAPPVVTLPVEPIREEQAPATLSEAARANDYATFASLYQQHPVAAYRPLYELWTYSVTDPIGAFYSEETYARLSRAYPGLAAAVARNRIVDDRGNAFYPTSETRAFLLERAMEGGEAPRVTIAHVRTTVTPVHTTKPAHATTSAHATSAHPTSVHTAKTAHATKHADTTKPAHTPKHAQTSKHARTSKPAHPVPASAAPSVVVHAEPAATTPEPVAATPPPAEAVAPPPAQAPATPPVIDATPADAPAAQEPVQIPQPAAKPDLASRGLLLVIIGLIGVGVLAVILRTPSDAAREPKAPIVPPVTPPPAPTEPEKPAAPVEPIRRASGQHRR